MGPRLGRSLLLLYLSAAVLSEDSPPGLVSKDSDQDLVAEASQNGAQAQKRDAGLSNSYGEPLPADAYGPPRDVPNDQPAQVYGVPEFQFFQQQDPPPGAYGPPAPVSFPSQVYEGPPPPISHKPVYGPPKQAYGPPKPIYGPPKQIYGGPKQKYGPPKQSLPKPVYGAPFKPPKFIIPKPVYGPPKPIYGVPKPVYGPPKVTYGTPLINVPVPLDLQTVNIGAGLGNIETLDLNLPAPIYGTPITSLPNDLQPNFPIPSDTYGPPGHQLGPVGPNDQVVVQDIGSIGHYGPPQPDPNPHPPHPGIPAPPTPPHVLYDGWKPIPGVSIPHGYNEQQLEHHEFHNEHQESQGSDQYGPPPPPPPQVQDLHLDIQGNSLPNIEQEQTFSGQINTGYSSVHQDALADIDLNAIVGGDSNHIDQSKTVFEAHYTEQNQQSQHQPEVQIIQLQSGFDKPSESYGPPSFETFSNGHFTGPRQHGAKGLIPPSGVYGVPPGSQYGAPPRPPHAALPIPYGTYSGGGHSIHTGGRTPSHPVKFREPVPDGLITNIAHTTHHKDNHGVDHFKAGPPYLPPPIRDVKESSQFNGNHGFSSLSLSIEPSNLYSLPHSGNPINFQGQSQGHSGNAINFHGQSQGHSGNAINFQGQSQGNSGNTINFQGHSGNQINFQAQGQSQLNSIYGSPVDSYAVPLYIGDHAGSASDQNSVTATVDGRVLLANLSNLDAAAILKHCPYHEAILKAARLGERIPQELAASYVASLSSLGSSLSKNKQVLISPHNGFNTPAAGSESVSYNTKDLSTASHTLIETIIPNNDRAKEQYEKNNIVKGKSIKENGKQNYKDEKLQFVSNQIQQTSEKIRNLSEETKQLQQKIVSTSQNIKQANQHLSQSEIPVKGKLGSYSLQIQSADGSGKTPPSIPHEQLLSEGLLQSILQAIEHPNQQQNPQISSQIKVQNQNIHFNQASSIDLTNLDAGGLILPAGYEPVDHTKSKSPLKPRKPQDQIVQGSLKHVHKVPGPHKHRGDIPDVHTECDLRPDNSVTRTIILPAPSAVDDQPVQEIDDNDVAVYFGDEKTNSQTEKSEPVTEISVATSISENIEHKKPEYGDKIQKNSS